MSDNNGNGDGNDPVKNDGSNDNKDPVKDVPVSNNKEPKDEPKDEPKEEPKEDEPKKEPKEGPTDEPKEDEPVQESTDEPEKYEPEEDEPEKDEPKEDESIQESTDEPEEEPIDDKLEEVGSDTDNSTDDSYDESSEGSESGDADDDLFKDPVINPERWEDLDVDQKNLLLDLNFYFKRVERLFDKIDELKTDLSNKYEEVEGLVDNIQTNILKLTDEEQVHYIEEDINSLEDLIEVAKKYGSPNPKRKFSVDVKVLHNIVKPLEKLRDVIGMEEVKEQIVDQLLTSLQSMYEDDIMFHTIIKGPPGVGKTLLAKVLGEIYFNMGVLKNDNKEMVFKIARRSDLIGKYLGHTAVKTQEFIDKCSGGVMFIDEVYSLGNPEKKDSFSKECIDTINLNLTEKRDFICIIAGYQDEIEKCFFNYNPGLKRRFPFSYEITSYTPKDLRRIFVSKIEKSGWELHKDIRDNLDKLDKFIGDRMDYFKNFGGDIENLILTTKIVHGRRVFGKDQLLRKKLIMEDIKKGFEKMILTKKKIDPIDDKPPFGMYL